MDKQSATTVAKQGDGPIITHVLHHLEHRLTLDDCGQVNINGERLVARPFPKILLCELIRANGNICTKESLNQALHPNVKTFGDGPVDVHISYLRGALRSVFPGLETLVTTVHSIGWRIDSARYVTPSIAHEEPVATIDGKSIYFPPWGGVEIDGEEAATTKQTTIVFKLLTENAGDICTWPDLARRLYGENQDLWRDPKILDVYICKLRKVLTPIFGRDIIATVWGCGYRLELVAEVSTSKQALLLSKLRLWFLRFGAKTTKNSSTTEPNPTAYVISPAGHVVTISDLPDPSKARTVRWVPSRKLAMIYLMAGGVINREWIHKHYPDLSDGELDRWIEIHDKLGPKGLTNRKLALAMM